MTRPSNAIARPAFMKLFKTMTAVTLDYKSMHKIVFIAKHVILKIHHKILCGSAQRVEADLITPICEGRFGRRKNNYFDKKHFDSTVIIPIWKKMAAPITYWGNLSVLLQHHFNTYINCFKNLRIPNEVERGKLFGSPTSTLFPRF